jgi:hypothetical protein
MAEQSSIEHRYTSTPVCPWCGYEDHDWWDGGIDNEDGAEADQECGSCEEPYQTVLHISYDFCTEKRDIEEEKRVNAERAVRKEEKRVVQLAAAQKFLPGTRVKVAQQKFPDRRNGATGTVANKELNKRAPYVTVDMDDDKWMRGSIFDADELERIEG